MHYGVYPGLSIKHNQLPSDALLSESNEGAGEVEQVAKGAGSDGFWGR